MPLFDFRCRACGRQFEVLVRPSAADGQPPAACDDCGSADLERLPSTFASSSSESRRASADKQIARAAKRGREETVQLDREAEEHRMEDHGHGHSH